MTGYFGPAHRNARLAYDRRLLVSYVARHKHALLFHPKLILADHMIVNSPNLPRAIHQFPTFRELFTPETIQIAHFERFVDRGEGGHMSLQELFDFYSRVPGPPVPI